MTAIKYYTEPKISPESLDIRKPWYVWFRFFDAQTGKHKQLRFKSDLSQFSKIKERLPRANALKQLLKEELENGWNPLVKKEYQPIKIYSIAKTFEYVLSLKSQTAKPKTIRTYTHITKLFLEWCKQRHLLDLQVKLITSQHAQQYMDQLLLKRKYSGRTFNDHLIILRTFFNCMISRKWCHDNPFKAIRKMETTTGRNLAYTDAEKDELSALLYEKDRQMFYLSQIMYYCFIRRTEMIKLKVGDFDLVNHTIIIRAEVSKNKRQETVVIPKGLEPILNEMRLRHYPKDYYVFGRYLLTSDVPFSNENHVSTRHNKFVKKLGYDAEKGLYSWKHTGACKAYYATNKDIYSLMRQLRHRDLNTTMIYLKSLGLVQNDVFRNAMVA